MFTIHTRRLSDIKPASEQTMGHGEQTYGKIKMIIYCLLTINGGGFWLIVMTICKSTHRFLKVNACHARSVNTHSRCGFPIFSIFVQVITRSLLITKSFISKLIPDHKKWKKKKLKTFLESNVAKVVATKITPHISAWILTLGDLRLHRKKPKATKAKHTHRWIVKISI